LIAGPGSNQTVAVTSLASQVGLSDEEIGVMWVGSESASFDNSLNVLSILSYPTLAAPLWVSPLQQVWKMTKVLTSAVDKVLPPGGMNVAGVLGHVGAVLELADQIFQKHMMPAPNCIFLPMGSGCTTTGLVTGIAMARVLGLGFSSLQVCIVV